MEVASRCLRKRCLVLLGLALAFYVDVRRAGEQSPQALTPHFRWAQTSDMVMIIVPISELDKESVSVTLDDHGGDCNISATDSTGTVSYLLRLPLREDVSEPKWNTQSSRVGDLSEILVTLKKRFVHRWDQLVQKPALFKGYMELDWSRGNESLAVDDEYDLVAEADGAYLQSLTEANFHDVLQKLKIVIVHVRFPWCSVCMRADKIYDKVAKTTHSWRKKAAARETWAKTGWYVLDAREERNLGRTMDAHCSRKQCGTFKVFTDADDEPETITGIRFASDLVEAIKKFWKPAIHWLESHEACAAISRNGTVTCIGQFPSRESREYLLWKSAAKTLRTELEFCAVFGSDGANVELLHPNGSDVTEPYVYNGIWTDNGTAILQWIRIHSVPLLQPRVWHLVERYTRMKIPVARVWLDDLTPELQPFNMKIRTLMRRLAKMYTGRVSFQESQRSVYLEETTDFALDYPLVLPAFALDCTSRRPDERYALHLEKDYWINKRLQKLTTKVWSDEEGLFKKLSEFIDRSLSGQQPTTHFSAEPQRSWSPGLIRKITWRELDEIRYPRKPMLLELYGSADRGEEDAFKEREVKALGHVLRPYANQFIMARYDGHFNYVPDDLFAGERDSKAQKTRMSSKWYWITADPDPSKAGKPIVKKLMQPPQDATMKEVIQFLKRVSRADIWVDELHQQQQAQQKILKRFKNFAKVEDLKPDSRGLNLLVQVVSKDPVEKTEGGVRETLVIGDETGIVTMVLESEEEHEHTKSGKTLEIRNSRVEQADGKIYIAVSKYGHIHPHDGEATIIPNTANDMSATDHEEDDDFDDEEDDEEEDTDGREEL